jgi:hypothetical protein
MCLNQARAFRELYIDAHDTVPVVLRLQACIVEGDVKGVELRNRAPQQTRAR